MTCELTWGNLLLHSEPESAHTDDYWFSMLGASFDLGRPEPVAQTVESLLRDGSMITTQRYDNRTVSFFVWVEAADGEGLARGEHALFLQAQQPLSEAKWTPPSENAAVSCLQIVAAAVEKADPPGATDDADVEEMFRLRRCYKLTWTCLPWALAEGTTSFGVVQPPVVDAPVLVTDGSSMARVTVVLATGPGSSNGSQIVLNTQYGAVAGTARGQWYGLEAKFDLTGLTTGDSSSTVYFYMDLKGINPQRKLSSGGAQNPLSSYAIGNGYTRFAWQISEADTSFDMYYYVEYDNPDPSLPFGFDNRTVYIDQIYLANQLPVPAGSEQLFTAQIQGSARATGSVQVSHSTAGLGKTLVYSAPQLSDGYAPPVRRFQVGSTATLTRASSPAFFSTVWQVLNAAVFEVPVSALPAGPFVLMSHLYANGGAISSAVSWTAQLKVGGNLIGPIQSATSDALSQTSGTDTMVSLGGMVLPPMAVQGGDAVIHIVMTAPTTAYFDDLFLLYQGDDSALTIVDCGSGTPALGAVHNSLWLDSPDVSNGGIPQILLGVDGDKTTALSAASMAQAWEVPQLPPGPLHVFIATAAVTSPDFSGSYRPAFHTHVATRAS